MKTIHLGYSDGHLAFDAIGANNRSIKFVIDTGAVNTLVFRDILINEQRISRRFEGVGNNVISKSFGTLITNVLSCRAYYVEQPKSYDVLLGIDWMMEHKASIDIAKLTMTYE